MSSDLFKVCQQSKYSDSFRNYFSFDQAGQIVVWSLTPFSILASFLNILFFYKLPNARQPPFDILLITSVFSFVNSAVYLSTAIYNQLNPINHTDLNQVPSDFNSFCLITGTMNFFTEIGAFTYNAIFCIYYTCKLKNPLRGWVRDHKQIHGLCFVLIILITVVIYLGNLIGVSPLGLCGLKVAKTSGFIQLGIFLTYLIILISTSIIFLKYLNRISRYDEKARLFFKYYMLYTILISVIYLLQCTVMIMLIVDCYTGLSQENYYIFAKTGNILVLITPIVATIIVAFHPQFGRKFLPQIFKKCLKNNEESQELFYQNLLSTSNRKSGVKQSIQLAVINQSQKGYFASIKQHNRLSLLSTLLGCISLSASERSFNTSLDNRSSIGSNQNDHIFSWNFADKYQLLLTQSIVSDQKQYFVQNIPKVMIKFISYSMSVFQNLMDQDEVDFVSNSINPYKNIEKIYQNAQADGGSSGQFFFFTHDNRILLKTITTKQLNVLLERLEMYYQYLHENPASLIVKIYGVFTVRNPQTQQELHFMMMGNLCEDINKKYVLRIYDCKGSTHKRQVFKENKQLQESQYSKKTMKDVDFDRLQNKVWVSPEDSINIKKTLKQDSLFFLGNGLIDYSLIIIKIDYQAYCSDLDEKERTYNPKRMFYSEKEPNIIYILGIIDYLETWNVKKKGERWYKSLFTKSQTISSQSPAFYSQRFCDNLIQKIFQ